MEKQKMKTRKDDESQIYVEIKDLRRFSYNDKLMSIYDKDILKVEYQFPNYKDTRRCYHEISTRMEYGLKSIIIDKAKFNLLSVKKEGLNKVKKQNKINRENWSKIFIELKDLRRFAVKGKTIYIYDNDILTAKYELQYMSNATHHYESITKALKYGAKSYVIDWSPDSVNEMIEDFANGKNIDDKWGK